jgi:hypothetical protein
MMEGMEGGSMASSVRMLIIVVCAACATPDDPMAPAPAPAEPRFTVTGWVYDSLASHVGPAQAAPGVRVSINGRVAITDGQGRFTVTGVLGGTDLPLELQSLEYEPDERSMTINRDVTVSLPLRRLAPLITWFFPAGDSTRFTVVDLQTRKAVERWQLTQATLANGPTQRIQHGDEWIWNPVDSITWLVSMPSTAGAEEFHFDIHDATGSASHAVCRVDSGCDHLAPIEAGAGW